MDIIASRMKCYDCRFRVDIWTDKTRISVNIRNHCIKENSIRSSPSVRYVVKITRYAFSNQAMCHYYQCHFFRCHFYLCHFFPYHFYHCHFSVTIFTCAVFPLRFLPVPFFPLPFLSLLFYQCHFTEHDHCRCYFTSAIVPS